MQGISMKQSSNLKNQIDQCIFLGNLRPIVFLSPHTSSWAKTGPQKSCMGRSYFRRVFFFLHDSVEINFVMEKILNLCTVTYVWDAIPQVTTLYRCFAELMQKLPFLEVTFFSNTAFEYRVHPSSLNVSFLFQWLHMNI